MASRSRESGAGGRSGRRTLTCAACGAGNRVTADAAEHGWFRCTHCRTPAPVPGVGDFVLQSPGRVVTRVVRPGASELETEDGFVFGAWPWLGVVVAFDAALSAFFWFLAPRAPEVHRALAWPLWGLLLLGAAAGLALVLARQRLVVTEGRVALSWVSAGMTLWTWTVETRRYRIRGRLGRRPGVELRSPGQGLFVFLDDERSVRWLERELGGAIEDVRVAGADERLPCPGCGGPVATQRALREVRGVDCPHCGTGLLHVRGGLTLPAASVGHRLEDVGEQVRVRPRRRGGALEWALPSWADHWPKAAPANLLVGLLLDAGVFAFAGWAIWRTPVLKGLVTLGVLVLCGASASTIAPMFRWIYGRVLLRLDDAVLEYRVRVGRWSSRVRRVPLSRVVSVEAELELLDLGDEPLPGNTVRVTVTTPLETVTLEIYGREKIAAVRDVVRALPGALRGMGRQVELTDRLREETAPEPEPAGTAAS